MDKNTIIGMLLMCAVIFGFMYLQQPSEEQLAEQRKAQQEQLAAEKAQQAVAAGAVSDTLATAEVALLDSLSRNATIATDAVHLTSVDGHAAGTIKVDGKEVTLDQVKAVLGDPRTQNLAVAAVKAALDKYAKNAPFAAHLTGTAQNITLQNDSLVVTVSTRGAMIVGARLKAYKAYRTQEDYKSKNSVPVELVKPGSNDYSFVLGDNTRRFDTRDFFFTPKQEGDTAVVMTLNLTGGATWSLRYSLDKDSYMVRMQVLQSGMDRIIPTNIRDMKLAWHQQLRRQEVGKNFEERNSALYYKYKGEDGDVDNLGEAGNKEENKDGTIKWFSAKSQFFSTVLIADNGFRGAQMKSIPYEPDNKLYNEYVKDFTVNTTVDYDARSANPASFLFFFGPNKYKVLRDYDRYSPQEDLKLTRLVSLGWTLFRWINTGIVIPVFNWLGNFGWNYGIIILVLTILIKLLLSPLTFKSYMSQAKMRILQPDIKALEEKYPGQENLTKRQQKQMELYSQAGANPMGGCLPMLLQMPVLIAMFWFFPASIELRGQSFLWAPDLSAPDAIISLPFSIPFLGDHLSIFCLLMTGTNILYTYLSMQSQQSSSMPGMKVMMYLMPVMFLVFFNNYAAGLSYYYFVSLLLTIVQTYLCRALVKEDKVRAVMAANARKPKKKNSWMARMEKLQREQQAAMREQEKRNAKRRK